MREFCHTSEVTQTPSNVSPPNLPEAPAAAGSPPIAAPQSAPEPAADVLVHTPTEQAAEQATVPEIGGRRDGTDPTRFGDWEKGGRCIDF